MRILVMGAGAIGGLIGGHLALAGHQVVFVDRPEVVPVLKREGLVITRRGKEFAVESPRIIHDPETAWPEEYADLAMVTVKSFDTRRVARSLAEMSCPPRKVITWQNGLGNEEVLQEALGPGKVISGTLTLPVDCPAPGRPIITDERGGLGLAGVEPGEQLESLLKQIAAAGLPVSAYADYRAMKWSKLLLNILCNGICAITDLSPGAVFTDLRLVEIERAAVREALAVMNRLGIKPIDLPGYPVRLLTSGFRYLPAVVLKALLRGRMARGRGDKMPSLQLDLSRNRGQSEVDFMNGAIARHAANLGLAAPANQLINTLLDALVAGRLPREEFRANPDRLWEEYQQCIQQPAPPAR